MGRVVHFEIAAEDVARARKFYEIFGWEATDASMPGMEYWLMKTGDDDKGIDGAISPRSEGSQPVLNTIAVDDLDAMISKVKAAGGKIEGEKMPIPGIGDYVTAVDTEGNKFGMLKPAPRNP
jgi:hypothetical protein